MAEQILTEHADALALADVSLWEAAKLVEFGRLILAVPFTEFLRQALSPELTVLPVTAAIAERVTSLERSGFHKDPADQLIVATALVHRLHLISADARIRTWGRVPILWSAERGRF